MTLGVRITHRLGDVTIEADFEAPAGATAIFGRSGAGKTTIIRAVSGLLRPDSGRIAIDGRTVFDSETGVFVPPHKRRIGYVFQEGRLFPHMTVQSNLTYGGQHDFDRLVDVLGLRSLLSRRPATLSGGERQRVALGRALMSRPDLLLLDEPLAALDAGRKAEILPYLERLRDEGGVPMIYVSHDISEIARLASTFVLVDKGKTRAAGPIGEVLSDPAMGGVLATRDAGAVISGKIGDHDAATGLTRFDFDGGAVLVAGGAVPVGIPARVRIAASDIILSLGKPEGISALNVIPVTITAIEPAGQSGVLVGLRAGSAMLLARITRASSEAMGLKTGARIHAIVKATAVMTGPMTDGDD